MNVLSASSCIFTLLLAGIFPSEPGDRITLSKMCAVCFNFSGVILVSYADIKDQTSQSNTKEVQDMPIGVIWALSGAFFYSVYIVLIRRKVQVKTILQNCGWLQILAGFRFRGNSSFTKKSQIRTCPS